LLRPTQTFKSGDARMPQILFLTLDLLSQTAWLRIWFVDNLMDRKREAEPEHDLCRNQPKAIFRENCAGYVGAPMGRFRRNEIREAQQP
jgi:hypothetical protein